jgi:hypothetical protein
MSFIKKILRTNTDRHEPAVRRGNSFASLDEEQLKAHLGINRYGDFVLTEAIRPSYDLDVVPKSGYRWDTYDDASTGVRIPVLLASASKEDLFELFMALLTPLGEQVDVVLETSHETHGDSHQDRYRDQMDLPILKSTLYEYEELIVNDGCAGIAVLNPRIPMEVQLDEHKMLVMYGRDLDRMESILMEFGLERDDEMKFLTEAEHVHSSTEEFQRQFDRLACQLGFEEQ